MSEAPAPATAAELPTPRGPLSEAVLSALRLDDPALLPAAPAAPSDPLADDDLQLTLWTCYELHYRGLAGVADRWEWDPALLGLRGRLEQIVLDALRRDVQVASDVRATDVPAQLRVIVDADTGPSLSRQLQHHGTPTQFREFAAHRSIYHLKEADPHTWAIPRLAGRAKAALVEIQSDEYGGGIPARMHSELFRRTLRGLDLDDRYAGYLDAVPGCTLAVSTVMSMFGLHRALRGAAVGHLAAFEMTSSAPNRRYSHGLRRLGFDTGTRRFYDEHVTADALHEQIAAHDLCGALALADPAVAAERPLRRGGCAPPRHPVRRARAGVLVGRAHILAHPAARTGRRPAADVGTAIGRRRLIAVHYVLPLRPARTPT